VAGAVTPSWTVPVWPAPQGVRVLSTWRGGGVSGGSYASLNLGGHVGDAAAAVAENRSRLRRAAGLPGEPVWLRQVHGIGVADLDAPGTGAGAGAGEPGADAACTRQPGRVCAILTADCLPLVFATEDGDRVGAAHAGWRGLAEGVIEAAVRALDVPPEALLVWLGPAIGPLHFEVGAEVREALLKRDLGAEAAFVPNARGRFMADLYALARRRLSALGVSRIFGGEECTYARADRYFSYRRDGVTGRQATLIWLENR
jgi:YfiH family protein